MSSTQHMDLFFGPFHTNPGLFLQFQNRVSGLSVGSPLIQHRFLLVELNSMPISDLLLTKTQFIAQIPTAIAQTVHGLSLNCLNGLQKFPTIRSQVLGQIKRPLTASINSIIHKTLKSRVNSSRIKPLPHGVFQNSLKPEPTRRPRCVEQLSFLLQRNPTVRLARNLERSPLLSH